MTPRTKDQVYSEILLKQLNERKTEFDLSFDAPLFDLIHPKVLSLTLDFEENPEMEVADVAIPGWYVYPSEKTSGKDAVSCRPYEIWKILNQNLTEAKLDLAPFGGAIISKEPKNLDSQKGLHQHVIPVWLHYALSSELWGPQGKWTRFHERLHTLFEKFHLLKEEAFPGYYPLQLKAQKLIDFGFKGTVTSDSFILVMPWSFPLSGLKKLEEIVHQEF